MQGEGLENNIKYVSLNSAPLTKPFFVRSTIVDVIQSQHEAGANLWPVMTKEITFVLFDHCL